VKTPLIIGLSVGAVVVAAVVTVIVASPRHDAPRYKPSEKPAAVTAPAPAKPVHTPATRQHVGQYSGGTDLKTPEPIKASDYKPTKLNPDIRKIKDPRSAESAGVMMPVSGPAAADRVVGRARMLKKEGRAGEATKLLNNAMRNETNPYYRQLIENEIKSGEGQRAPAGTSTNFD